MNGFEHGKRMLDLEEEVKKQLQLKQLYKIKE